MVQCWGEAHQARPRGDSRQKGRFIQRINQLKAAGPEKVVCLAARAALSFTEARRAHILSYDRLQVAIKERKRFQEEISRRQYLLVDKCLVFWFLPSPCNTGYNLAKNMGVVTYIWFLVSIWKNISLFEVFVKGAGASEAGGQTKEGALSKRYFQTSEIAQNRTKSPVPIVIDVFGVTAPYGNPYGSKIAIVWLFFVIFWPFWSHFQLLWSRLCIKLAPSAPKPSSHIGPLMRQPFLPDPGAYPGIQGPKNGYFLAKSGPNGPGWLQARPVHLGRAWCAISHPNWNFAREIHFDQKWQIQPPNSMAKL